MRRHWILPVIVIIVSLLMIPVHGETEPNDDPGSAQRLNTLPVRGHVSEDDADTFELELDPEMMATVHLEMMDGTDLHLFTVDEDGDTIWYGGIVLGIYEAGDERNDTIINGGQTSERYYFRITGSGNYTISSVVEPIPNYADSHSSKETALRVEEGIYEDSVTSGDFGMDNGDVDFFVISLSPEERLEVTLTMINAPEGRLFTHISCEGEGPYDGLFDLFYLSVDDEGESDTGCYINDDTEKVDYYLTVSGDGEYRLDISTKDLSSREDLTAGGILVKMCGIIIGGCLGLIIIALLISIIVITGRRNRSP
ncbi:hypothetical protein B6U90_01635 [Thermoplasmatales archaeon ex4484_6]|nr:MAG: hypothetical protein B6U90_01635 [Thermoplasmatales archaeon ex4484_6]RLF66620.1 MAG: hypothetical protein DRN57_06745 [Thermoplasmata archaeon]